MARKKSGPITIRLTHEIEACVREMADVEDRSVSYVIDRLLRSELERAGRVVPLKRAKSAA